MSIIVALGLAKDPAQSHPVCLNVGLMKPWRGSTPIMDKGKTGRQHELTKVRLS